MGHPTWLPLTLLLAGCAQAPVVHRMERARTTFVVADPGAVQRAWRGFGGLPDDEKMNVNNERLSTIHGFARVLADGWCEVWLSWRADMSTVLHEMGHCEGMP